jgi:hypothetical protein
MIWKTSWNTFAVDGHGIHQVRRTWLGQWQYRLCRINGEPSSDVTGIDPHTGNAHFADAKSYVRVTSRRR